MHCTDFFYLEATGVSFNEMPHFREEIQANMEKAKELDRDRDMKRRGKCARNLMTYAIQVKIT